MAYCWTLWRRRFVEYSRTTHSPICLEMTNRIAQLYRIEADIRGKAPDVRRAVRQQLSKPILDALRLWLEGQLDLLSSSSDLARHIRYGLKRWVGLTRFLDDACIEMDANAVENCNSPMHKRSTDWRSPHMSFRYLICKTCFFTSPSRDIGL